MEEMVVDNFIARARGAMRSGNYYSEKKMEKYKASVSRHYGSHGIEYGKRYIAGLFPKVVFLLVLLTIISFVI